MVGRNLDRGSVRRMLVRACTGQRDPTPRDAGHEDVSTYDDNTVEEIRGRGSRNVVPIEFKGLYIDNRQFSPFSVTSSW